jgi:hypothetical protein
MVWPIEAMLDLGDLTRTGPPRRQARGIRNHSGERGSNHSCKNDAAPTPVPTRSGDEKSNGCRNHDWWPVTPYANFAVDFRFLCFVPLRSLGFDHGLANRKIPFESKERNNPSQKKDEKWQAVGSKEAHRISAATSAAK